MLADLPNAPAAPTAPAARSTADALQRLERALHVLLAPLDHPDWMTWRDAVHAELMALTGADGLGMFTPIEPGMAAWHAPHVDPASLHAFATELRPHDVVDRSFARLDTPVAHELEILDRPALLDSVVYNEFARPNALFNLTMARADFGAGDVARLWFTDSGGESADEPDEGRARLVRTVLPALRAGLATWLRVGAERDALGRLLDAIPDPVLLFRGNGALLHANPAAARLLGAVADGDRVRDEAQRVAWSVAAFARRGRAGATLADVSLAAQGALREVRGASGATWRLRGSLAAEGMLGSEPTVLVTLESVAPAPLADDELRSRFGLTDREIAVARLVAEGLSNHEVAARLGLSFYTARNHVERVLAKLGVGNRARIGVLLRGG